MTHNAFILDGSALPLPQIQQILHGPVTVIIPQNQNNAILEGRKRLQETQQTGQPIYGMTTGVGARKYTHYAGDAIDQFGRDMGYAHDFGVGSCVRIGIARLCLALRLNTLLNGRVGVTPEFSTHLQTMLNHDILPAMTQCGSVGCADLGQLGLLASTMDGKGKVWWKGAITDTQTAYAAANITPYTMRPREGLAAVASNCFGIASSFCAMLQTRYRLQQAIYQSLVTSLTAGLNRNVWKAAQHSAYPQEQNIATFLLDHTKDPNPWPVRDGVHDPLSGRFIVQVLAACLHSVEEAITVLLQATAHTDDNPIVSPENGIITSGASHHAILAMRLNSVQFSLAMLARNLFNHCSLLTNGTLQGLPVNLVPPTCHATGYGPLMKLVMEQHSRVAAASMPVTPYALPLCGGLEDESLLIPLMAERVDAQNDALGWILTITALLTTQALCLSKTPLSLYAATLKNIVRRHIPPFERDIPLQTPLTTLRHDLDDVYMKGVIEETVSPLF